MTRHHRKGKRFITPKDNAAKLPIAKSLMKQICALDNLQVASKKVIAKGGSHGSDRITVEEYRLLKDTLDKQLTDQFEQGTYEPLPHPPRLCKLDKGDGTYRTITIPTVYDRVAQQAVLNVIEPLFESEFMDCSYGFRRGRNAHQALASVTEHIRQGNHWVVKGDISKYFDTIPHKGLMNKVSTVIKDKETIALISKMIANKEGIGLPQGAVISPILANIYLHEIDHYAAEMNWQIVRYADDYILLFKTEQEAIKGAALSLGFLSANLGLTSKNKDGHAAAAIHWEQGFDFLSYTIYKGGLKVSNKASAKLIKEITEKIKAVSAADHSLERVITSVNESLRGWANYFTYGNGAEIFRELDAKVRELLRASRVVPRGMPNQKLMEAGLVSLHRVYREAKDG